MKKTGVLEQLKTYYTGTTKELEEKVSGWAAGVWIGEGVLTGYTLGRTLAGEFDGITAISMPFVVDYLSRLYTGVKQRFKKPPEHTPNLVGRIKELYVDDDKPKA